jgi:hypothetical protein
MTSYPSSTWLKDFPIMSQIVNNLIDLNYLNKAKVNIRSKPDAEGRCFLRSDETLSIVKPLAVALLKRYAATGRRSNAAF